MRPEDMSECPECLQAASKQELKENSGFCADCMEYLMNRALIDLEKENINTDTSTTIAAAGSRQRTKKSD